MGKKEHSGSKIDEDNFEVEEYNRGDLLDCYEKWRKREAKSVLNSYQTATELLKEYKIPFLSEDYINEFMEKTEPNQYDYDGIFLSAIINEVYKNEEIHLSSDKLHCLGCYNKNKKIIVNGDCLGDEVGSDMEGGEIIVKGNCNDKIGDMMVGGKIIVEGNCGNDTGFLMKGGELVVKGNCKGKIGVIMGGGIIKIYGDDFNPKEQIANSAEKGEIYYKDKLVWKDHKFISDSI